MRKWLFDIELHKTTNQKIKPAMSRDAIVQFDICSRQLMIWGSAEKFLIRKINRLFEHDKSHQLFLLLLLLLLL